MHKGTFIVILFSSVSRNRVAAFGDPKYFTPYRVNADTDVQLKVPNFDVLFDEILKASPLAKQAVFDSKPLGFDGIDKASDEYKWKVIEQNPKRVVSEVAKIDNFQNKKVPLVRLRSSLKGPTYKSGFCFSELISVAKLRQAHDATNAEVYQIHSAADLREVQPFVPPQYGETVLFGIGYTKTKQSVVSPREQLTLCGLQEFPSGASILWGVEMEEDQNHLMPENDRTPRATSHLFANTVIPTSENEFDVEYCLQIDLGGFPGWLTGPVVVDAVKKCFRYAERYFGEGHEENSQLAARLNELRAAESLNGSGTSDIGPSLGGWDGREIDQALLMTP